MTTNTDINKLKENMIATDKAFNDACAKVKSFSHGSAEMLEAVEVMSKALDAANAAEDAYNVAASYSRIVARHN